ncbi:MAG: phosphohydrolase, partial [Saprospiraceae bacterium]|nr:phosphohydrolase [Saprospiraceae bacterium]
TKEETIMMLADSIEAACKSLKDPSEKELMEFIDKIIQHKVTQGQLDDSAMTFKELEACSKVFKKIMRSVHHIRIEYPEEEKK